MIPKIFAKEHGYAPFPPFISAVPGLVPPGLVRADFAADPQAIPPNANIETILQNHRRKMLRRAANRRSAQLSRARKKVISAICPFLTRLIIYPGPFRGFKS